MEKYLSVFEGHQLFEKKCAKNKFLILVKKVHFLAFQFTLEIQSTLDLETTLRQRGRGF